MYDFSKLWRFPGGLKLAEHKRQSTELPVLKSTLPQQLILSLRQYNGTNAEPTVSVEDAVINGQAIAVDDAGNSVLHAPSSGRIIAIEPRLILQSDKKTSTCIVIKTDGQDHWGDRMEPVDDFQQSEPAELLSRIRNAGIVGLGGAGFPSADKLVANTIDLVVLNGAECEPFISCDDRLMRERAAAVISGLLIIKHILQASQAVIAIEDNKPEAYQALERALADLAVDNHHIGLRSIPTIYPSGGERQLIRILTGLEVPGGGYPSDIGIVCQNVATAAAIHDAVVLGQPLISRYVTVTGPGVRQPRVVEAAIGTPVRDLIEQCGGYSDGDQQLTAGGPMMGFTLTNDSIGIAKSSHCILVRPTQPTPLEMPCIRCGACVEVCPARLLPQQLYWHSKARQFEQAQEHHLFDCIECACCVVVCPSQIPLVDYYRQAKAEIRNQELKRQQAEHARQRFEARQQRLEREEAERKLRREQKKAQLHNASEASVNDDKKAAIQAALARARAKKQKSVK